MFPRINAGVAAKFQSLGLLPLVTAAEGLINDGGLLQPIAFGRAPHARQEIFPPATVGSVFCRGLLMGARLAKPVCRADSPAPLVFLRVGTLPRFGAQPEFLKRELPNRCAVREQLRKLASVILQPPAAALPPG